MCLAQRPLLDSTLTHPRIQPANDSASLVCLSVITQHAVLNAHGHAPSVAVRGSRETTGVFEPNLEPKWNIPVDGPRAKLSHRTLPPLRPTGPPWPGAEGFRHEIRPDRPVVCFKRTGFSAPFITRFYSRHINGFGILLLLFGHGGPVGLGGRGGAEEGGRRGGAHATGGSWSPPRSIPKKIPVDGASRPTRRVAPIQSPPPPASGSGVQHIAVHTNSRPHLRRIGKWAGRTQRKTKGTRLGVGVRAGARVEARSWG